MPICHLCGKKVKNIEYHLIGEKHTNKIRDMMLAGYSILYLSNNSVELFGEKISYDMITTTCKHHQIKIPSLKDTANSQITRDLYKNTIEKTYGHGISNVSQSKIVKEKKNNTNLRRYGVINPFQREEVKKKSKETLYQKYGVYNTFELPWYTQNIGRLSRPHKKVSDYLTTVNIAHENDKAGLFRKFNDNLGRVYSPIPDIFIPNKNIVIEIFGDWWHMNPKLYNSSDIVMFFDGPHSGAEVWARDEIRKNHILTFGFDIIVIWEYDIKHNFDSIKQMLFKRLT